MATLTLVGYHGHQPFGSLRAPRQPRHGNLVLNAEATIFRIQQWARECVQDHPSCSSGGFSPRRLLYVAGSRHGQQTIRLVETWPDFSRPFVALSHCWGKTRQATTTKANYAQRLSGIAPEGLSRTFQDAIWVTRELGLRYLWIDSLCVIQDDPDDWEREASKMSQLYGAAYLTLAASHGADGNAGLFPLAARENSPILLSTTGTDPERESRTSVVTLLPIPCLRPESIVHQVFGKDGADESCPIPISEPLLGRGWAFQERALSARVVHFTRQELVWECKTKQCCDCGAIMMSGMSFMASLMGSLKRQTAGRTDDSDQRPMPRDDREAQYIKGSATEVGARTQHSILEPERVWKKIVRMYTGRQLTKAEDRAAAFAGIAFAFSNMFGSEDDDIVGVFAAGLWDSFLPGMLLWSCASRSFLDLPGPERGRRVKDSKLPSWSWYSVTGPCAFLDEPWQRSSCGGPRVFMRDDDFTPEVDFNYHVSDEFAFQYMSGGKLDILGATLLLARRDSADEDFSLVKNDVRRCDSCAIYLLADDPADEAVVMEMYCLCLRRGEHGYAGDADHDIGDHDLDERVTRAVEMGIPFPITEHECDEHLFGIALVKISGRDSETYERIGLFHAEGRGCLWDDAADFVMPCGTMILPASGFEEAYRDSVIVKDKITLS